MESVTFDKIFISLKEAESLIFNKMVAIPSSRLIEVKKRGGNYSIIPELDHSKVFVLKNHIIIFSSAVKNFDIPKDDFNLFRNHYRVPVGLLSTSDVKFKDVKKVTVKNEVTGNLGYSFDEEKFDFNLNDFTLLRNALFSSFLSSLKNDSALDVFKESSLFIANDDIAYKALQPHMVIRDFVKVQKEGNYSVVVERFRGVLAAVWAAAKIQETNLQKDILQKWIKDIIDSNPTNTTDFCEKLILCDICFPKDWEGYKTFIYVLTYLSFGKEDLLEIRKGFPKDLAEKLQINFAEVQFWNSFFYGLFSDKVANIYLIESLREWQFFIELLSFCKANNIALASLDKFSFDTFLSSQLPIQITSMSKEYKEKIALEYYKLSSNSKANKISIISDLPEIFKEIPIDSKKKVNANKPVIIGYAKDFKVLGNFRKVLSSTSENTKTSTIVVINEIVETEEDIFSLDFEKKLNDFKSNLEYAISKKFEVLITIPEKSNKNDLIRNLKKIFSENKVKDDKSIFVVDYKHNEEVSKCIVSALPATLFWDKDSKFHFFSS